MSSQLGPRSLPKKLSHTSMICAVIDDSFFLSMYAMYVCMSAYCEFVIVNEKNQEN